jgi:uncharacterized membrane protein YgaE (UPF0421/DUF939 family)
VVVLAPHLRSAAWRHPRLLLAGKTALAAGAAWLLVQPFGGFVDDYPYYAPLGAVVATSTSVVGAARTAAQAVAAILAGAALAVTVNALPLAEPLAIAIGIGIGVLVAGVRGFGTMGSWVPFATLFVLLIGSDDPAEYVAAYGGLTALGAALGVAVNLVVPQLPLTPATLAQERLREQLADQLDLLADGLDHAEPLSPDDWAELRLALHPQARRVEELVQATSEARRANWRARRWAEAADRGEEQARALQRLTGCVDEVISLVGDVRTAVHADEELAAGLRERSSAALRAVAAMLRSVEGEAEEGEEPDAPLTASGHAADAVAHLAEEASRAAGAGGERYLGAAAIAVSLQQAVDAWS